MNVLVVDIGGTWTRVAIASGAPGASGARNLSRKSAASQHWNLGPPLRLRSGEFTSFDTLLEFALAQLAPASEPIAAVGIALAGPVAGTGIRAWGSPTNLAWPKLEAERITARLGLSVALINDFVAVGKSLSALGEEDKLTLQAGTPEVDGLCLVVGAGTGLGTCLVTPSPTSRSVRVYPGEGGHAEFAASSREQGELAAWIRAQAGRCSREHILSGKGIIRIAEFLLLRQEDPELRQATLQTEAGSAIGHLARAGNRPAQQVMRWFFQMLAEQVADIALGALPRGGVFIAGGIAPQWSDWLRTPDFLEAFRCKPPMGHLMEQLPVHLVTHPEPGLLGAAVAAADPWLTTGDLA